MKKLFPLFISLVLLSCQDDDDSKRTPGGSTSSECKIIQEQVYYGNDSIYKTTTDYVYSGNLLTKKVESSRFGSTDSVIYSYNSSNQLTHILRFDNFTRRLDTSQLLQYDALGNVVRIAEKIFGSGNGNEFVFRYTGKNLNQITFNYNTTDREVVQIFSDVNQNIVEYRFIESSGQPTPDERAVITYDNMKNPFQGLYFEDVPILEMFGENNYTDLQYYEGNALRVSESVNFEYNNLGYPVKSVSITTNGDTVNRIFKYDCF